MNVEFAGGGTAEQATRPVKGPGVDARVLPAWGFYARNVERVTIEDVRLSCAQNDLRPVLLAEGVKQLTLDNFKFTRVPGVAELLVLTNVARVDLRDSVWSGRGAP